MKLSKNRLIEILKEEISLYINSVKTEKLMTKINESTEPNYSPKKGFTLIQFIMKLDDELGLQDVKFVKEDSGKMVFSTTTLANNFIVQSLNKDKELPSSRALDDGNGGTLLYFEKEEGVDTSDISVNES